MLTIQVPLFGGKCYVCYDRTEFIDFTGEEVHERTLALCAREKRIPMYLPTKDCLNHELIHMAWYLLDFYGVKIDVENHEMLAYLHDSLRDIIEADINFQSLPIKQNA